MTFVLIAAALLLYVLFRKSKPVRHESKPNHWACGCPTNLFGLHTVDCNHKVGWGE